MDYASATLQYLSANVFAATMPGGVTLVDRSRSNASCGALMTRSRLATPTALDIILLVDRAAYAFPFVVKCLLGRIF